MKTLESVLREWAGKSERAELAGKVEVTGYGVVLTLAPASGMVAHVDFAVTGDRAVCVQPPDNPGEE